MQVKFYLPKRELFGTAVSQRVLQGERGRKPILILSRQPRSWHIWQAESMEERHIKGNILNLAMILF